jgi:hypothetical protein
VAELALARLDWAGKGCLVGAVAAELGLTEADPDILQGAIRPVPHIEVLVRSAPELVVVPRHNDDVVGLVPLLFLGLGLALDLGGS